MSSFYKSDVLVDPTLLVNPMISAWAVCMFRQKGKKMIDNIPTTKTTGSPYRIAGSV